MSQPYRCTLPLPPSANDLVRPAVLGFKNKKPVIRLVKTTEAKQWLMKAQHLLVRAPLSGPVELFAEFYMPTIASDCSNRVKQLEDALTGFAWLDDKQVAEVHAVKRIATTPSEVRVVVTIHEASAMEHPLLTERLAQSAKRAEKAEKPADKMRRLAKPATYIGGSR